MGYALYVALLGHNSGGELFFSGLQPWGTTVLAYAASVLSPYAVAAGGGAAGGGTVGGGSNVQYLFGEPIVRQPLLFEAPILGTVLLSFVAGWRLLCRLP